MTPTTSTSTHGTGLKGSGVPQIISRFFGDPSQWPVESNLKKFTQAKILAIAEHIDRTGDCLWHAEFVVMGWDTCHCAKCSPPVHSIRCDCVECMRKRGAL